MNDSHEELVLVAEEVVDYRLLPQRRSQALERAIDELLLQVIRRQLLIFQDPRHFNEIIHQYRTSIGSLQ